MATPPYFSVGIPTYNRASFLQRAVSNLLHQTHSDFEIIVGDNCSNDETPEVMSRFKDPRIRYVRHQRNLGAMGNFKFLADHSSGEFLVIHQDDDLLHRDFLRNCFQTVVNRPEVTLYATPWWRGNPTTGFKSKLLVEPGRKDSDSIVQDSPLILDGVEMAVSLLHSFYFAHPTLAFRREALAAVGGYYDDPNNISDVITEARVLCLGKLAYDPRIGGIFTDHADNTSRTMEKRFKVLTYRNMYTKLVEDFEKRGIDWARILRRDLAVYPDGALLALFADWARYGAPKRLQRVGWECIRGRRSFAGSRLFTKVSRKVGFGNMLRFLRAR